MRSIDSWLDRFAYKHPRFGIPNLMLIIVAGSVLVYMVDMVSRYSFSPLLALDMAAVFHGQVWRLVTFVFVTFAGDPVTLILSLYFYWWAGSTLEREWGTAKFSLYYLAGVVFNILVGAVSHLLGGGSLVTMQYVNMSLFFAFATLFPDMQILLFFFIPVKVKWMAWLDAALFAVLILADLISLNFVSAVLAVAAILNYVLFFWSDITGFLRRRRQRAKYQNSRQTINFKQATRQAQQQKGYIHKCAVCGKTDADFPDEEFRYCSQCNGYYCYCSEHIHDHVHIQ